MLKFPSLQCRIKKNNADESKVEMSMFTISTTDVNSII